MKKPGEWPGFFKEFNRNSSSGKHRNDVVQDFHGSTFDSERLLSVPGSHKHFTRLQRRD
jgi:hypothetical protein